MRVLRLDIHLFYLIRGLIIQQFSLEEFLATQRRVKRKRGESQHGNEHNERTGRVPCGKVGCDCCAFQEPINKKTGGHRQKTEAQQSEDAKAVK